MMLAHPAPEPGAVLGESAQLSRLTVLGPLGVRPDELPAGIGAGVGSRGPSVEPTVAIIAGNAESRPPNPATSASAGVGAPSVSEARVGSCVVIVSPPSCLTTPIAWGALFKHAVGRPAGHR